jgi:hypothetical protein
MARLTNENKGKIVTYFANGTSTTEIAEKMGISESAIENFLAKLFSAVPTEKTEAVEEDFVVSSNADLSKYQSVVLELIKEGAKEPDAYFCVYSVAPQALSLDECRRQAMIKLGNMKSDAAVHESGRAVSMTEGASMNNPHEYKQVTNTESRGLGEYVFTVDGT